MNLPGYSLGFNTDEAIWGWDREESSGNLRLGCKAKVQETVGSFLAGLTSRKDEVKRRGRTVLPCATRQTDFQHHGNTHPTLALV